MTRSRRIEISIDDQRLHLIEEGHPVKSYLISTAAKGMGCQIGSHRTPTGRFRVMEKIGEGAEIGTIFKNREPVGVWHPENGTDGDFILSRIIRLEGLEFENRNSADRYIYIHGTHREDLLGSPASHGCVRMSNSEMIELFDLLSTGDEVRIHPATKKGVGLFFIDCDSTLSSIEGIDELARTKGEDVFREVVALTHAAMNGEVAIHEVFSKRMEIIRPDRETCERVAQTYLETIVPGAREWIGEIKKRGWIPVVLSGGFAPLILPLARELGIDHVEAVPLHLDDAGFYAGYGSDYPTTRNLGKNEIIREWQAAMLPAAVLMMGDGVSDLETKPDVDAFIGFGGVVERKPVREGSDFWITDMKKVSEIHHLLGGFDMSGKMV